jgi:hypothetical protein
MGTVRLGYEGMVPIGDNKLSWNTKGGENGIVARSEGFSFIFG